MSVCPLVLGLVTVLGHGLGQLSAHPLPLPLTHLDYASPAPTAYHYTLIHPPTQNHKFYTVPLSFSKPVLVYSPYQEPFFLLQNHVQLQLPTPSSVQQTSKVSLPAQHLVVPVPAHELSPVDPDQADVQKGVEKEEEQDDTVAVETEDSKAEVGREDKSRETEALEAEGQKAELDSEDEAEKLKETGEETEVKETEVQETEVQETEVQEADEPTEAAEDLDDE